MGMVDIKLKKTTKIHVIQNDDTQKILLSFWIFFLLTLKSTTDAAVWKKIASANTQHMQN